MTKKAIPSGAYEVGYKKPPSHTRFQKGMTGNPRGRPKGSRNLGTMIDKVFSRKIVATEGGRTRRISIAEALLTKIMSKAIAGDIAAQRLSIMLLQLGQSDAPPPTTLFDSDDDRALLRNALDDLMDTPPASASKRAKSRTPRPARKKGAP